MHICDSHIANVDVACQSFLPCCYGSFRGCCVYFSYGGQLAKVEELNTNIYIGDQVDIADGSIGHYWIGMEIALSNYICYVQLMCHLSLHNCYEKILGMQERMVWNDSYATISWALPSLCYQLVILS